MPESEIAKSSEPIGQVASPISRSAHPAVGARYELREVQAYETDRLVFADMVERNPKVRAALSASKGTIDHSGVDQDDAEEIGKLLSTVDEFMLRGSSGDILRFGPTLVAVIPGAKGQRNFSAYLIRIPKGQWMLLEMKEMP